MSLTENDISPVWGSKNIPAKILTGIVQLSKRPYPRRTRLLNLPLFDSSLDSTDRYLHLRLVRSYKGAILVWPFIPPLGQWEWFPPLYIRGPFTPHTKTCRTVRAFTFMYKPLTKPSPRYSNLDFILLPETRPPQKSNVLTSYSRHITITCPDNVRLKNRVFQPRLNCARLDWCPFPSLITNPARARLDCITIQPIGSPDKYIIIHFQGFEV